MQVQSSFTSNCGWATTHIRSCTMVWLFIDCSDTPPGGELDRLPVFCGCKPWFRTHRFVWR